MDRHIDDIELIRKEICTEQLILVGQSFGGILSASYTSKYPEKVQSVIFTAPGELRPQSLAEQRKIKKELLESDIKFATETIDGFEPDLAEGIRFAAAVLMCKFGSSATAENLISQEEIKQYATRMIPEAIHMAYHLDYTDQVPKIKSGGINVLVNASLHANYQQKATSIIEQLRDVEVPALVLRTEYDYVNWEATRYYHELFVNSHLVSITESGHIPWSVNIDDTYNSMVYFLSGRYDQLKVYTGASDPRLDM